MKKSHKFQIFRNSDKSKQNVSQNIDSGRSMVEMLGVLAVIGVLSVASILGYRYAMAKWRANETVNELNIRAYDIATRFDKLVASNTREIEMEMGDTTKLGYPIMARISPQYEDYFEMFVSNVPTDVCKELLNSQWQAPYSIFVGIEEYEASSDICEQAENVQLAYEFYKDLSTREEVPEETRHKIQRCNHKNNCQCGTCNEEIGLCESECEKDQVCLKRYDDSRWMKCCDKENKVGDFCCDYVEDGKCCNYNGKCCPPEKPLMDKNGKCYSCDYADGIYLSNPDTCSTSCPKRYLNNSSDKVCVLCGVAGTTVANKPLVTYNGKCYACSYAGGFDMGGHVSGTWGQCKGKCPNERRNIRGMCYPVCSGEKPLLATDGKCYACDDTEHSIRNDALIGECGTTICPGQRTVKGDFCIAVCPEKTILGSDGKCYSCDYEDGIYLTDPNTCSTTCPKRYLNNSTDKVCVLCGAAGTTVANKPLVTYNGKCYACSYAGGFDMGGHVSGTWGQCKGKCPNERRNIRGMCYPVCSGEKPLLATDGKCYACDDTEHSIRNDALTGECGTTICPGQRTVKGDFCIAVCPEKTILGSDGKCYSCDYEDGISLSNPDTCSISCPKRYLNNSSDKVCVLCGAAGTSVANKPLVTYQGKCYACSYAGGFDMGNHVPGTWGQCKGKCPNERRNIRGMCYPVCSDDKPLLDSSGSCLNCNTKNATLSIDCDKCTNRIVENNTCVRQKCLSGYFEGSNGECYACNITTSIPVKDEEDCKVCLNRTYKDDMCLENN